MKETIKVQPEQLPAGRRTVDKLMGYGNIIDGGFIIGGVVFSNPAFILGGAAGLIGTGILRDRLRRIPKETAVKPEGMKTEALTNNSEYPRTRQPLPQAA